jgi:hypothetical protein
MTKLYDPAEDTLQDAVSEDENDHAVNNGSPIENEGGQDDVSE